MRLVPLTLASSLLFFPTAARASDPFALADGDRVVFVGSTLIEREQRYGYWETMLTSHFPDKNITFRNLGWSGDTVFGDARAGFETQAEGYRRLTEHVLALKPTVIFIGYGTNESFEGEAGLSKFVEGFNKLLDDLAPAKARIVLLSPLKHEDLGRPRPDPGEANKNLRLYCDAIRKIADKRQCRFVNLYELVGERKDKPAVLLTDNGVHLTAYGYWRAAAALEQGLGLKPFENSLSFGGNQENVAINAEGPVTSCPPPAERPARASFRWGQITWSASGLTEGKYQLKIDGKAQAVATAKEWKSGLTFEEGPLFNPADKLREAIVAKNRLYFHRWRPQNETYLFGFRKAEQGKNAKEIPEFDPLVEKMETEIAKLRYSTQTWDLVREGEK
jgi:lysophospholipase L1-like esterase